MGLEEEIEEIREEIAETPYNKSTEAHIGRLKAKLAQKKEELAQRQAESGGGGGYGVEQHGDATVALVGFPSVGKSTLLNALTNADSDVASYEFTTLDVNPGMLEYRGASIQVLDVPGLVAGAATGRGSGREVLSVIRTADLVLILLSAFEIEQYDQLRSELDANQVRLDQAPPRVTVAERSQGGIDVTTGPDVDLAEETVTEVLREHGYANAAITIREDLDVDGLVDALMDNRVYLPSLVAVNKTDLVDDDYRSTVRADLEAVGLDPEDVVFISAETERGLEELTEAVWETLGLIRVYLDDPGEGVDRDEPLVLGDGRRTVDDALRTIGGSFEERFKFARVTGPSAKHDEQQVGRDHELRDGDVLRIVAHT